MSKFNKEEKEEIIGEVFRRTNASMRKTRITMCNLADHSWRKVSDSELACKICPTMLIVKNADDYLN